MSSGALDVSAVSGWTHKSIISFRFCGHVDKNTHFCSGKEAADRLRCPACLNDLPVFDSTPLRYKITSFPGSELPPTRPGKGAEEDADLPVTGHNVSDTAVPQQPLLHLVMCLHPGAAMFVPTSSRVHKVYIYEPEAEVSNLRWRNEGEKKKQYKKKKNRKNINSIFFKSILLKIRLN